MRAPIREERLFKGSLWMISSQLFSVCLQAVDLVLMGRTLGSRDPLEPSSEWSPWWRVLTPFGGALGAGDDCAAQRQP